jgi:hypothetical protein
MKDKMVMRHVVDIYFLKDKDTIVLLALKNQFNPLLSVGDVKLLTLVK